MEETPRQVTRDPKRQKHGQKSHGTYMKKLWEDRLRDNLFSYSFSTNNSTPSVSSFQITLQLLPLLLQIALPLDLVISIPMALVQFLCHP